MTQNLVKQFDTLDDRREIRTLFAALPPAERVRFVAWACRVSPGIRGMLPAFDFTRNTLDNVRAAGRCDRADAAVTCEMYGLLWRLTATWGLDVDAVLAALVAVARGKVTAAELLTRTPDPTRKAADGGNPAAGRVHCPAWT